MKITITEQDIKGGHRFDPDECAIARALNRAGFVHLGVMGPSVMMSDQSGRVVPVPLPATARHWILDFDSGKQVGPVSFEFNPVEAPSVPEADAMTRSSNAAPFKSPFWTIPVEDRPSCRSREPELCGAV